MSYKRKVQYYETDRMGIVHHSNYIRYFEEARTEYMKQNGIDYSLVEKDMGIMMPVLAVDCQYRQGAKYGDIVNIETEISKFNGIKLTFCYKIYGEDGSLLVNGSSTHCFVNMDFKPVMIKKTTVELYNKLKSLTKE